MWAFPGGHLEPGETSADAAIRETFEETGCPVNIVGFPHTRQIRDNVDFTTYKKAVLNEFVPKLNYEHTKFMWCQPHSPPAPLHPGCEISLRRDSMNELDVARAIQSGELASPTRFQNMSLVKMRVTGTGAAYRMGIDEFVWRDPSLYLKQEFLDRCYVPVIWEHPKKSILNSQEYANRVIGNVMLPFIQDDEVWCVARIYDDEAVEAIDNNTLSTSPAVVFGPSSGNKKLTLEDGSKLLIEGEPTLIDHLAICGIREDGTPIPGVWDKGLELTGVVADSQRTTPMPEEKMEEKKEEAKMDADAGEKLDKVLAHLDSMHGRCDAIDKRLDAMEEEKKADAARKDNEGKIPGEEPGAAKELAADKAKKDAEVEDPGITEDKKKADKARKDAEEAEKKADAAMADSQAARAENKELRTLIEGLSARMPKQVTDSDYQELAACQHRADTVFQGFGEFAPRPLDGETPGLYRRRLTGLLKVHSPQWKDVDVQAMQDSAFDIMEKQVFADAAISAKNPDVPDGGIRAIPEIDPITGRRSVKFVGSSFIRQFKPVSRTFKLNRDPNHPISA